MPINPGNTTAIEIRDLRFNYPDGRAALNGINLSIGEGERVGLIGPNGAGKSTLLLHLNGILPENLNAGSGVSIYGNTVLAESVFEIRRDVGVLFQDPDDQLFCPTVYEDVAFGPEQFGLGKDGVESIVRSALEQVGLSGYENRSPHHLSSGEKQRVCLAGILACKPRILVLDEPTRALDPRGRKMLKSLLQSLTATIVLVTHDLELVVELCPRSVVLDGGIICADGPTIPLLSDEAFMESHGLEKPHILRHSHPH